MELHTACLAEWQPLRMVTLARNAENKPSDSHPPSPSALDEGVSLIREGHFGRALVKLELAQRIAPHDAVIENLLGITATQFGHIDEASKHDRNAIRFDLLQAAPHRNLGFNLLTAKDYAGAEPELREASHPAPADQLAHFYLLLALATSRDAETLEQASHVGQLVDNDPEAAAGLIEAEVRMGHPDEAASRIERLEQAGQLPHAREYRIAVLLSPHA